MNNGIAVKLHKDREEVRSFCGRHKKIYIYGAGNVSGLICRYLEEERLKIDGIIVTDGHKVNDTFCGIKIYELSQIRIDEDTGIILGVGVKNQKDIVEILQGIQMKKEHIYCQSIYGAYSSANIMHDGLVNNKLEDSVSEPGFFGSNFSLDSIGLRYGTDKASTFHNYLCKYELFLKSYKNKKFILLELGVLDGSSLKMWEDYFPDADIYGVDIDERCKKAEGGRRKVLIKDISYEESLEELKDLKPAIIINDASHNWSHQIKSMHCLIPILPSGGLFIMEDLETSFAGYRNAGFDDSCISTYEVCEQIARIVCGNEVIRKEKSKATVWELKTEIENIASAIEMISFIHGSCIMVKR